MRAERDRGADNDGPAAARLAISVRTLKTPVGVLRVAASLERVLAVELPRRRSDAPPERWLRSHLTRAEPPVLHTALAQLREYFAGKRQQFDVPIDTGGTEFQQRVWDAVAAIPFGETTSYGKIAATLGGLQLARAVGAASGRTPI